MKGLRIVPPTTNGNSSTSLLSMVTLDFAFSVDNARALAETSTAVTEVPTSSVASARTVAEALSTRPVMLAGRKPAFSTRTVYVPTCSWGTVYSPLELDGALNATPVCVLLSRIFAPGMTAPEASRTVPVMVPRSD